MVLAPRQNPIIDSMFKLHSVNNSTLTATVSSSGSEVRSSLTARDSLDLLLTRAPERRELRLLPVLTTSSSDGGPQRAHPRSSVTRAVGDILPVVRTRSWPTCVTSRWRPRFFCRHDVALRYITTRHLIRRERSWGLKHVGIALCQRTISSVSARIRASFCAGRRLHLSLRGVDSDQLKGIFVN